MVKKLLVLLLFYSSFTYAETIKTDVLVIGGSVSGATAAMQCARSKVKTILMMPGAWLETGMPAGNNYIITSNREILSGIWGEFTDRVKDFYKNTTGYDAAANITLKFDAAVGANVLKGVADTTKNLTVKLNTLFTSIKKDGTGWDVTVTENGNTNTIKTKVLIDATEKGAVVSKAGATLPPELDRNRTDGGELYRTSIAISDVQPDEFVPMRDVVVRDAENLLITEKALPANRTLQHLPLQMELGQGVGTVAAYIAFYKTTAKNLKVRIVQQELLDFNGYLLPFADVKRNDRYIRAVQQIGATGMLKGKQTSEGLLFMPGSVVNTVEIEPVLTEIYSRAFLWFNKEKPGEKFTVSNLLSLISEFTLSDPKTLQITMKSDWKGRFDFASDFDLRRPVTRLEFAALVNKYLNPFARTIDLAGNVIN